MSNLPRKKRTILFLAANPQNSTPLDLSREVAEIEEGLQRSQKRDKFVLKQVWAATPSDVQRAMLDHKPQIVHFSGHGTGEGGLVLENTMGQAQFVRSGALAGLFELFANQVECIVLNACYSEVQAQAIAHHIPYVMGMNQAVGDRAARTFAVGFYDALGAGEAFEFAYKLGRNRIALEGIPGDLAPVMIQKSEVESMPLAETPETSEEIRTLVAAEPSRRLSTIPMTAIALEEPEGQVPLESFLYVERPPIEMRCYEAIVKPGALIGIKAPRQMGKSSLMLRVLQYGHEQGYQTASLNFQLVDRDSLRELDQFLQWFCLSITDELNLEEKLADYWKGPLSPKNKCTNYFYRYLLPALQRPVVLCLDEVDQVFEHPAIATDFFGMLRAWHEDAKSKPIWKNLRLVIVHSKEVYIPLNINQSPFNVGIHIHLPQLTHAQVMDLTQRHGLNWAEPEVKRLMQMVGGHPYLVRVALYHLARGEMSLDQLLEVAPTEGDLYGNHLRRHLLNLKDDEKLLAAMKRLIEVDYPISMDTGDAFKLSSMGLVQFRGSKVSLICDLYRRYFRERLTDFEDCGVEEGQPVEPVCTSVYEIPEWTSATNDSNQEIYISYAWGGESETFVNRLDTAFQANNVTIIRDKRNLGYKGQIKEFMERIGRGKCVITIISDKYLKSPNCMFELVQIAENGHLYDRIFPVVLTDAQIYRPTERIKYVRHWEDQIKELDEAMRGVSAANLQGFREEIDQYTQIRNTIAELTGILKNMNTLTAEIHSESDFEALFQAIESKLAE